MWSTQSTSKNRSPPLSCVICIHKNILVSARGQYSLVLFIPSKPLDASITFKVGIKTCNPKEWEKGEYRTRAGEAVFRVGEAAEHWTKTCTVSRQFQYRSYM